VHNSTAACELVYADGAPQAAPVPEVPLAPRAPQSVRRTPLAIQARFALPVLVGAPTALIGRGAVVRKAAKQQANGRLANERQRQWRRWGHQRTGLPPDSTTRIAVHALPPLGRNWCRKNPCQAASQAARAQLVEGSCRRGTNWCPEERLNQTRSTGLVL
jgi:hypothetical protein